MGTDPEPRSDQELLAALPDPWPRDDVRVPNGTLSVRRAAPLGRGSSEPALFIHGLGGSSLNWTDLMALLRPQVDGLAVDRDALLDRLEVRARVGADPQPGGGEQLREDPGRARLAVRPREVDRRELELRHVEHHGLSELSVLRGVERLAQFHFTLRAQAVIARAFAFALALALTLWGLTGCWTVASFAPSQPGTRPARKPEQVRVFSCAPSSGFVVLGRLTAIKSSLMPINRQDVPFSDPDGLEAMRSVAAEQGCDAIIGMPQRADAPCACEASAACGVCDGTRRRRAVSG